MQESINETHNQEKYQSIMKMTEVSELADDFITAIKNYITLMKEIEGDPKKWKNIP